jgi:hypothetical protein
MNDKNYYRAFTLEISSDTRAQYSHLRFRRVPQSHRQRSCVGRRIGANGVADREVLIRISPGWSRARRFTPGHISVRFDGTTDALRKLLALAMAIRNDELLFERLATRTQ